MLSIDTTDSIFVPRFAETGATKQYLEMLERQRWLFDNMLLMPKYQVWIQRNVMIQRVAATTSIEGAGLGTEAVGLLAKKSSAAKSPTEAEQANINAIRAYEFVDYLSDQPDIPLDELVIRELNRSFMFGSAELLTPGVYRKGQNKVGNFLPPNQGDVPDLMRAFAKWLKNPSDLHPVIKAGLAHIHLVAIHPFWDGNGRTARALATIILQRSPFSFKKLLSLEATFAVLRDDYITAIERTLGMAFSTEYNASQWLEFFALHSSTAGGILTNKLTDWHRMLESIFQTLRRLGVNERQTEGIAFALHTGKITRGDYMEITKVSPVTASRDLAFLVRSGILEAHGRTKDRSYTCIKPQPRQEPQIPAEQLELLRG